MWELICHHRYCWGAIAADRSAWGSNGQCFGVQPLTDHIGLHFPGPQSRIVIPRSEPWLSLTGIRIEIVTRLADTEGWLIDGGTAFGLHLNRDLLIGKGRGRDVINTYDAPLSIPLDQWIRLTFEHNGFNAMALFIDDALAATGTVENPIPGLGAQGVVIGNAFGVTQGHLHGDIESVKVWRIDPRAMEREFSARPLDPATAKCWDEFVRAVRDALRAHPDCARWLSNAISDRQRDFAKALAQKDQRDIDEFIKMTGQYAELWRAGLIDSPQMLELAARFRAWLIAKGLFDPADPELQKLADDRCFQLFVKLLPPLACDPQVMALLTVLAGHPPAAQGAAKVLK